MTSLTTYFRSLPVAPAAGAVSRAVDVLLAWHERALQRHQLAEMDERMLADIGIDRAAAIGEAEKPFWRP